MKRRRPGVLRIRLGELRLSPPCNTFCKMDAINKEHKCRDSGDPMRKPIEGTEKGELVKEADDMIRDALVLIMTLVCMKDRQRWEGKMQVVEGVGLDLRGMEWFLENPVDMQDYNVMWEFEATFDYPIVKLVVDYCAWGNPSGPLRPGV